MERNDRDAITRTWIVRVGVRALHAIANRLDLGARLLHRRAGREPGDDLRHPVRAPLHHQRTRVVRADDHVHDRVELAREKRRGLNHADDRHRLPFDDDLFADDVHVAAELIHPIIVRQLHHRLDGGAIVAVVERAAESGRESHHLEVVAGDETDLHAHGLLVGLARDIDGRILGDPLQTLGAGTEVVDLRHREIDVLAPGSIDRLAEVHEAVAVAMRQRLEEHPAHDAEDRGVRPDSEAKRQDDGDREARRANQAPVGKAKIGLGHGGLERLRRYDVGHTTGSLTEHRVSPSRRTAGGEFDTPRPESTFGAAVAGVKTQS